MTESVRRNGRRPLLDHCTAPRPEERSSGDDDCLHTIRSAQLPNPHATAQHFIFRSSNRMPQVGNSWGRGHPWGSLAPRCKSLAASNKKFSSVVQNSPLIRTGRRLRARRAAHDGGAERAEIRAPGSGFRGREPGGNGRTTRPPALER
jgi:hypothetical protein